ncbi:MAG: uncharacterized protein A8A55_3342, partial [Amphiamblys sp. WSBS2006]
MFSLKEEAKQQGREMFIFLGQHGRICCLEERSKHHRVIEYKKRLFLFQSKHILKEEHLTEEHLLCLVCRGRRNSELFYFFCSEKHAAICETCWLEKENFYRHSCPRCRSYPDIKKEAGDLMRRMCLTRPRLIRSFAKETCSGAS